MATGFQESGKHESVWIDLHKGTDLQGWARTATHATLPWRTGLEREGGPQHFGSAELRGNERLK